MFIYLNTYSITQVFKFVNTFSNEFRQIRKTTRFCGIVAPFVKPIYPKISQLAEFPAQEIIVLFPAQEIIVRATPTAYNTPTGGEKWGWGGGGVGRRAQL